VYLTREQERLLRGDYGWAIAKAMELLVRVGDAVGASELVEVKHAHVSGVSYSNIGKYGLDLIIDFYRGGGRARVYTTINPGCIDYSGFSRIIDNRFYMEQRAIDNALVNMGFKPVFTCIPYYYRPPLPGEHLAWGESSAVIYANSIYGAYTNREGGPIALASSITGYTYKAGLHILDNRVGRVRVRLDPMVEKYPAGAIGLWIGENIREIPVLTGFKNMGFGDLKVLLASMAASGSHAIAIIEGVTPRKTFSLEIRDEVFIERGDLEDYIGPDVTSRDSVLGYIGCPHLHPLELLRVKNLVGKYGGVKRGGLLITIPPEYLAKFHDIVFYLKSRGVDIATGTCPVVSVFKQRYDVVLTNSGKAAFYLRRIHGLKTRISPLEEVVKYVCSH